MYLIKRHIYILFLYFFLIFLLIFDLIFTKYQYKHTFFIKNNENLTDITSNLYKETIINNKFFFKLAVRLALAEKVLKAGEYQFYNNNIFQIIKKIKIGENFQRKITIPEGMTTQEIVNFLKKKEDIIVDHKTSKEPIKEGMLFPNTYYYSYGTNFNIIIDTLLDAPEENNNVRRAIAYEDNLVDTGTGMRNLEYIRFANPSSNE